MKKSYKDLLSDYEKIQKTLKENNNLSEDSQAQLTKRAKNYQKVIYQTALMMQHAADFADFNKLDFISDAMLADVDSQIEQLEKVLSKKMRESLRGAIENSLDDTHMASLFSEKFADVKEFKLKDGAVQIPIKLDESKVKLRKEIKAVCQL